MTSMGAPLHGSVHVHIWMGLEWHRLRRLYQPAPNQVSCIAYAMLSYARGVFVNVVWEHFSALTVPGRSSAPFGRQFTT